MINGRNFVVLLLCSVAFSCHAMVFDNRYFPMMQKPYVHVPGRMSHASMDFFVTTASHGFDASEHEVGIAEILGGYDQNKLANAFVAAGMTNPLRSDWQGGTIPWRIKGKLQSQGLGMSFQQRLCDYCKIGFYWAFMRVTSRHDFEYQANEGNLVLGNGDFLELDEARRSMHNQLGLSGDHSNRVGVCDIDAYMEVGKRWERTLKFRSVDMRFRLGGLIPTGTKRDRCVPTSVPFGGDGHGGLYGSGRVDFEIKEDWTTGIFLRLSKRFERTFAERLPAGDEHPLYGTLLRETSVKPGVTFVFSPYMIFENLREGLGMGLHYTLIKHAQDSVKDQCCDENSATASIERFEKVSAWGSDYVTFNVFYDFGKVKPDRGFDPVAFFVVDMPLEAWATSRCAKTYKISLGVEVNF